MSTIKTFLRSTWANIAGLGTIAEVMAVDTHYIQVRYSELTPTGVRVAIEYPASMVMNALGEHILGFSVTYKQGNSDQDIMKQVLSKASNIFAKSNVTNIHLNDLHNILGWGEQSIHIDSDRYSHAIRNEYGITVFHGREYQDESWANTLTKLHDTYAIKLAANRVTWYQWLATAKYVAHHSGDLFKFPNGLSVKFDNRGETINGTSSRIFCETWDREGETNRFYNEAEFLTWLTKYF